MAAAKAHEVASTHQVAGTHDAVKHSESAASTAASEASIRLLQDAQVFSEIVNASAAPSPSGFYTQVTRPYGMAETVNAKLNQVNDMSPADRKTWLADLNKASNDTGLQQSFVNFTNPVGIDVHTGSDGKADSFQLTTTNFDQSAMTSNKATIDAAVGAADAQNVHFDATKTDPQFAKNEVVGFGDVTKQSIAPADIAEYAAEVQAMPANLRQEMIQDTKKILPKVKMNTDTQGNLQSIDFSGGHMTPADWNASVKNRAALMAAAVTPDIQEELTRYDAPRTKSAATPSSYDGEDYYEPSQSTRGGSGGSDGGGNNRSSAPPSGTVVEGVGANSGTYIMNSDGTASRWGN